MGGDIYDKVNGMKKPPEGISINEEGYDQLTERVDECVEFLVELNSFISDSEIVIGMSVDEFKDKIDSMFKDFCEKEGIGESVVEGALDACDLTMYLRDKRNAPFKGEIRKSVAKRRSLLSNDNVYFTYEILQQINHLVEQKTEHDRLRSLYETDMPHFKYWVNRFFEKKYRTSLSDKPVYRAGFSKFLKDVRFDGFSVTLVFDKKIRSRGDISGIHGARYKNTNIILLFTDSPDTTEKHERNHVVFSPLSQNRIVYGNEFVHGVITDLQQEDAIKRIAPDGVEARTKTDVVKRRIKWYSNKLNGELLADLDRIFDSGGIQGFYPHFDEAVANLKISILYDESILNEDEQKTVAGFIQELEDKIENIINALQRIRHVATKKNIIQEAKCAILLFEGDIRKVERYVRNKVGEDVYKVIISEVDTESEEYVLKREH